MKPSQNNLRNRQVEYLARDLLRDQGYEVVRSAGAYSPVDLVAWKGDQSLLFIRTTRSRRVFADIVEMAARFRPEIAALRRMPRLPYLSVQLWVYYNHEGWRFYDVFPRNREVGGMNVLDGEYR
jgi:Holliday junction resolvase